MAKSINPPARASETAHFDLDPTLLTAVPDAFAHLLDCLAQLHEAEEAAAPCWAQFPSVAFDWAALERAQTAALAATEAVLALDTTRPADRSLKAGALKVRLTLIGMHGPMDRPGERRSIEEAAARLVLSGSDAGENRVTRCFALPSRICAGFPRSPRRMPRPRISRPHPGIARRLLPSPDLAHQVLTRISV